MEKHVEQQPVLIDEPISPLRRSTRTRQPTRDILDRISQQDLEFHDFYGDTCTPRTIAFNTDNQVYYKSIHEDNYKLQNELEIPITFLASTE